MITCQICERPRDDHLPGCDYEKSLVAAADRMREALAVFFAPVRKFVEETLDRLLTAGRAKS